MEKRNVIEAGYGVLCALALSACSSTPPPAAAAETERSAGDEQATTPTADSAAAARGPDTAARSRAQIALADIVTWINGAPVDEQMYAERFTPDFVASVPYASFAPIVAQLKGEPWQVAHVDSESDTQLVAHLTRGAQKLRVSLGITPAEPARIAGLIFAPDEEHKPFVAPASATEAIERLKKFGALSLLVASTGNGRCEPLLQVEADRSQPLGSAFKLWVLAAVSTQVKAGKLRWTDPVVIRDKLDSLPSGTTQNDRDGSTHTVRELAERMIAISDNTATDHLIVQVGRDAVQKAVAASGHAHPEANRPFLTTRELFILKFGDDAALRTDYLAANEAGRRKLLDTRVAGARLPDLVEAERKIAAGPLSIHEIEWFGSAFDLCRVWLVLDADPAAREILAINPGVPAPAGRWSYLGFKGGSESGVLATAWRHDAASGSYVTAASIENPESVLPESEVVQLLAALRDFTPKF